MIENLISVEGKFSMRINFNLKSLANVGSDKCQIWLTTTINKKRVRIYTGLLIAPSHWLKTTKTQIGERAREDNTLGAVDLQRCKEINKRLSEILGYCRDYAAQVSVSNLMCEPLEHTPQNFKEFIADKIHGREALVRKSAEEYIKDYIERKRTMTNKTTRRTLVSGTIYNHVNALQRLQKFCREKRLHLTWELFDRRFEDSFTAWLNKQEYSANTIASEYSIIKVWLAEAEKDGLIKDPSFHHYTTTVQEVENIALTEEEIQRIYDLDFEDEQIKSQVAYPLEQGSHIEETRDLFCLACWTGLRYGDWRDLSKAVIEDDCMKVHTRKTNTDVIIPLHPMVKAILEKYNGQLPSAVDKSKTLRHIRTCARLAGITQINSLSRVKGGISHASVKERCEHLMNHTARRSFATNMYLRNVPSVSIMAITGHTSEANFLKYIKVDKRKHAEIIAKAFTDTH